MKKVYAMMAMALTIGLSASAAPKSVQHKEWVDAPMTLEGVVIPKAAKAPAATAPAKAISSAADLIGAYKANWYGLLNSTDEGGEHADFLDIVAGSDATSVNVLLGGTNVKALVNAPRGTITISNNTPTGETDANGNAIKVYIRRYTITETDEGYQFSQQQTAGSIQGKIGEDGVITWPENYAIGLSHDGIVNDGRWYILRAMNVYTPQPFNVPDLSEYEELGTAKFTDGWFNPLLVLSNVDPINDVDVTVLRKKDNHNYMVLKNPYSDPAWKEIGLEYEGANGEGYIIIDATEPDFVQVLPLTDCGMITDDSDEDEGQAPGTVLTHYYPYNKEGELGFAGEDILGYLELWQTAGQDCSNMTGNTISLYNLFFGISGATASHYWWTNNKALRFSSIALETSGIQNIGLDTDSPKRYYNLQGMEISKPVKGQVVIVKQGKKSFKTIAK